MVENERAPGMASGIDLVSQPLVRCSEWQQACWYLQEPKWWLPGLLSCAHPLFACGPDGPLVVWPRCSTRTLPTLKSVQLVTQASE